MESWLYQNNKGLLGLRKKLSNEAQVSSHESLG